MLFLGLFVIRHRKLTESTPLMKRGGLLFILGCSHLQVVEKLTGSSTQ